MKRFLFAFIVLLGTTSALSATAATNTYYCCKVNNDTNLNEAVGNPHDVAQGTPQYTQVYNECRSSQGTLYPSPCAGTAPSSAPLDTPTNQGTRLSEPNQQATQTQATPPTTPAQLSGRVTLPNPLGTTSPQALLGRVIKAILSIVGSITLLMFIYGGVLWLTAGISTDGAKRGKTILSSATIGLVIIFSSYIILRYIFGALQGTFTP